MFDPNERVTQSFTLGELASLADPRWRDAQLAGLATTPASGPQTDRVVARLRVLARELLQPIRDHVGRPVRINSGYRCAARNAATHGSSPTSQHVLGEAADISVPGFTDHDLRTLFDWIAYHSGLRYGQVIFEDARPDENGGSWIHISLGAPYRPVSRCHQRWTWTPGAGYVRLK